MKNATIPSLLLYALALAGSAAAQTWVSNSGNDANACTLAAPCKTFQRAVNVTPVSGQVGVLNAGDYGPVTITQSIRIDGGGFASSYFTASTPFTINTPAGSVVEIRHLSVHGNGSAYEGIFWGLAGALDIDDVQVTGFNYGILIDPFAVSDVFIKDSSVENCSGTGLYFNGGAKIENTHVRGCAYGLYDYNANVAAYNSTFSSPVGPPASGTYGIFTDGAANIFVDNCEFNGFWVGIWSAGSVQVSRSSFIGNNTAVDYFVTSNGNNSFFNNVSNGTFSSTVPLM